MIPRSRWSSRYGTCPSRCMARRRSSAVEPDPVSSRETGRPSYYPPRFLCPTRYLLGGAACGAPWCVATGARRHNPSRRSVATVSRDGAWSRSRGEGDRNMMLNAGLVIPRGGAAALVERVTQAEQPRRSAGLDDGGRTDRRPGDRLRRGRGRDRADRAGHGGHADLPAPPDHPGGPGDRARRPCAGQHPPRRRDEPQADDRRVVRDSDGQAAGPSARVRDDPARPALGGCGRLLRGLLHGQDGPARERHPAQDSGADLGAAPECFPPGRRDRRRRDLLGHPDRLPDGDRPARDAGRRRGRGPGASAPGRARAGRDLDRPGQPRGTPFARSSRSTPSCRSTRRCSRRRATRSRPMPR